MRKFLSREVGLALRKSIPFPAGSLWGPARACLVIPQHPSCPLTALTTILFVGGRSTVRGTRNNRQDLVDDCEENHRTSYFLFFFLIHSQFHLSEICHYFLAQISHVDKKLELLYKHWSYHARQLARSYRSAVSTCFLLQNSAFLETAS